MFESRTQTVFFYHILIQLYRYKYYIYDVGNHLYDCGSVRDVWRSRARGDRLLKSVRKKAKADGEKEDTISGENLNRVIGDFFFFFKSKNRIITHLKSFELRKANFQPNLCPLRLQLVHFSRWNNKNKPFFHKTKLNH